MKTLKNLSLLPHDACYDELDSPIGSLFIMGSSQGLHAVYGIMIVKILNIKMFLLNLNFQKKKKSLLTQ